MEVTNHWNANLSANI